MKNYKITNYEFNCVKALTNSNDNKRFLFKLPFDEMTIKDFCKKNEEIIFQKLLETDVYSYNQDLLNNTSITSYSKLTFMPKRFDIIIKNNYVYFYLKEED